MSTTDALRVVALIETKLNIQIVSLKRRTKQMDPWDVFSELCRQVVEEGNVFLDVLIYKNGIEMQLMPLDEEDSEGDE
jgi:hypothetical protein